MKKTPFVIVAAIALAFALIGCAGKNAPDSEGTIVIGDRFFVSQVQEIFINRQNFFGSTVRYEGIFERVGARVEGDVFWVIRYTIGCCGEEPIGFEVILPEGAPLPEEGAWVEVVGTLERGAHSAIALRAASITPKAERGALFVLEGLQSETFRPGKKA